MRRVYVVLAAVAIAADALIAGGAAAGAKLVGAKLEPAVVEAGDHVVITAQVEDPARQVAKAEATVVEYPVMKLPLNDQGTGDDKQAGDGIWSGGFDIPGAPGGVYHIEVALLDADGKVIEADGKPATAVMPLELKQPQLPSKVSNEELLAMAAPWRTDKQIARITATPVSTPLRFVVMGDSRSNPKVFADLLAVTASLKPAFSINTGDIVPGGEPDEFAYFFTQIKDVNWPFLIVPGNHDTGPSRGRLYEELFGRPDYYFDYAGIRFVAVDNATGKITAEQLAWLSDVLTTDLCKFVFIHMPPSVIKKWDFHAFSAGAQEFADLVAAKKVERVYVGHIHGFGVAEYEGVRYVLTGGAGAGLYERLAPGNIHNIVLVQVGTRQDGTQSIRETVYKPDGSSFVVNDAEWIAAGQ